MLDEVYGGDYIDIANQEVYNTSPTRLKVSMLIERVQLSSTLS